MMSLQQMPTQPVVKIMHTPDDGLPPVLTIDEAAKVMRCGKNKMYDLTRRKGFPVYRDGWRLFIPRDEMFRWLNEQARANTGEAIQR